MSSLAAIAARAIASLSPEGRKLVEEHVTRADRLVSDVFQGITTWKLVGSDDLWVRAMDLAEVAEVNPNSMVELIRSLEERGELGTGDVKKNVRENDICNANVGSPDNTVSRGPVTTSPRGVTMLSLRGARLLVMSCRGERGIRFRVGLDNALQYVAEAERAIFALMLAEAEKKAAPPDNSIALKQIAALNLMTARLNAGRKRNPAFLTNLAKGLPADAPGRQRKRAPKPALVAALPGPVQDEPVPARAEVVPLPMRALSDGHSFGDSEPEWSPGFTLSTSMIANALGETTAKTGALLKKYGMREDDSWRETGIAYVVRAGRRAQELRVRYRTGAVAELQRRMNPLLNPMRNTESSE
jgi:hypothetical protein